MRGLLTVIVCVLALVLGSFQTASASLQNFGFETGDFTGWAQGSYGTYEVVTGFTASIEVGNSYYYTANEGKYFAKLTAGLCDVATTVAQAGYLDAGDTWAGVAAFFAMDYQEYNDRAYVAVYQLTTSTVVWSKSISEVGDYGYTLWQEWAWTAPQPGMYALVYGVVNVQDSQCSSYGLFDAGPLAPSVPIPGAIWLLGSGLLGLMGLRMRNGRTH